MASKGACAVVVFAVNVVGDGSADGHEIGSRHNRWKPPPGYGQGQNFRQQHAAFTSQDTFNRIKCDEAVEAARIQQ